MPSYRDAFGNLKQYDDKIEQLTLQLYNQVSDTLKGLIVDNDVKLREAQRQLLLAYNKALESTAFIDVFTAETVKVIVASSYIKGMPASKKQNWTNYLWNKSLFNDNVKLSKRIRNNGINIIRDQKIALKTALKEGKSIAQIVGNIGDDTIKGFTR